MNSSLRNEPIERNQWVQLECSVKTIMNHGRTQEIKWRKLAMELTHIRFSDAVSNLRSTFGR